MCHSINAVTARVEYPESLDNLRKPTSLIIIYIYYNWSVSQDQRTLQSIWSHFVFAHWAELPGCNTGRQLTKVDRSGQTPTFSWHWPRSDPKTHTSSVLATGCEHISLQNHTEWPPRDAFLHTNDDSEELVKGAAPEFLDLGREPKPAISHFARPTPPCHRPLCTCPSKTLWLKSGLSCF